MRQDRIGMHGAMWGLIIGIVYCLLLFLRYYTGETSPMMFSLCAFASFVIAIIMLLVSGFSIRKKLGGYIELKEAFKAMFIAVLVFEFMYALFNFIYLKYVNPDFFVHFRNATEDFLQKAGQSQSQIDKTLGAIDVDAPRKMNLFDLLKGYLFWVAISGALAFVLALIIKRKRPFQDTENNFLQVQQ
jgi:hypothetical protein